MKKHFIMQNKLLLPNKYKILGWVLLIPATILGIILTISGFDEDWITAKVFIFFTDEFFGEGKKFTFIKTNITNTVVGILFITGALLVGFSREKKEDEYISNLRLSSLLWAVWVSYTLLLLSFVFVYGLAFFHVMVFNMFTVMIIFIVRFNYILYKNSKSVPDEK